MFDIRYQYALRTTSFEEQPLSDRTLSRFVLLNPADPEATYRKNAGSTLGMLET